MFMAMRILRNADETKRQAAFLKQQLSQQELYYEHVKQEAESTAQIRHDLRNQIQTAYALISDGDSETAKKILDELSEKTSTKVYFCDNRVVNALMNEKAALCQKSGIELSSSIAVGRELPVKEIDLCSLFANVMDNAINACMKSGTHKSQIDISAREDKGYIVLKCTNTADRQSEKKAERQSLSEHGWGLTILKDLAGRYNGRLNTAQNDAEFETTVFLKCG